MWEWGLPCCGGFCPSWWEAAERGGLFKEPKFLEWCLSLCRGPAEGSLHLCWHSGCPLQALAE